MIIEAARGCRDPRVQGEQRGKPIAGSAPLAGLEEEETGRFHSFWLQGLRQKTEKGGGEYKVKRGERVNEN